MYLQLQGTPVNIIVGSNVWVEDLELAWIDGQVSKINGQEAEIENTNGKKVHFLLLNVMCLFLSFSSLACKSTKSSEIAFMFVLWNSPLLLVLGSNFYFDAIKIVAKLSKIYPKDMEAPAGGVDDMTKLSYLHEPGVLQNLKIRYELNEIYVSFPPFMLKNLLSFYSKWESLLCITMVSAIIYAFISIMIDLYWKYPYCH